MPYIPITPVIVPIVHRESCIIQDKKTYCEKNEVSGRDFGFLLLAVASLILYFVFIIWFSEKVESGLPLLIGSVLLLLVPALILIF